VVKILHILWNLEGHCYICTIFCSLHNAK